MSWQTVRPQIQTLLQSISGIQEVSGTPKMKFTGYPAAYVVPSDSEGDYETNKENIRTYVFIIRIFYQTKNIGVGEAMERLEKVVDTVLDTFDQEDLKGSDTRTVGISLPSGYQFINIFAHPSAWGEYIDEELLMAELKVRVRISRDIT